VGTDVNSSARGKGLMCRLLLCAFLPSIEVLTDICRSTMCSISVGHVKQLIPQVGEKKTMLTIDLAKTGKTLSHK